MTGARRSELVLAVYPFTRGFAFTLFEGPLSPIDWGVKDIRGRQKNALALDAAKQLIEHLQPDIVVLQDSSGSHGRRSERIHRLHRLIASHAEGQAIEVHRYSRKDIRKCFKETGAVTRYEIAQAIASQIHALGHRLPPVRKIWKSEDARMGLFDAASLVMTFYCQGGERSEAASAKIEWLE
jgi:hypothetical protein